MARRFRPPPAEDRRTRVDRMLDRIKNNPVAALLIVAAIGLGGLAGLGDSLKKIGDLMPALRSAPNVAGEWRSAPAQFYPIGPEIMVLRLKEPIEGRLVGDVEFLTAQGQVRSRRFDVLEGKRVGRTINFDFSSGAWLAQANGPTITLKESVTGELVGEELHLLYVRQGHAGVTATARRIP